MTETISGHFYVTFEFVPFPSMEVAGIVTYSLTSQQVAN